MHIGHGDDRNALRVCQTAMLRWLAVLQLPLVRPGQRQAEAGGRLHLLDRTESLQSGLTYI